MASLRRRFPVLALLLAAVGRSGAASSHSLRYFYTALSEPSHGLPRFVQVGYVDDQPITHYDSHTRKKVPLVPWMEKVVEDDAGYWETGTQILQGTESDFRDSLKILQARHNQSYGGLHTWQGMYSCEVEPDRHSQEGRIGGHIQFGYDGEDFIALDMKTLTWTATSPQAQLTKKRWEELNNMHSFNAYLLGVCTPWLQKYLEYGKEALLRTEAPTVRVAHKNKDVDRKTLICQLDGFYPKEIDVTWRKDGEVWHQDTFHGGVVPNSDGTYHTWRSIDIDPKERGLYRCHVEHDGLEKPLDLAWEEPVFPLGILLGNLCALLAVNNIVAIVVFLRKKRKKDYKAAPRSDSWSDNHSKVFIPWA